MNVLDAIRKKRAVRQFQDRPLPEEIIREILYAGRRAQSSKNSQPWHFIAIQDKTRLKALSEMGDYAGHLAGAALGIAIITKHPETRFSLMFDAGQAAAYMQLAALELGVASCLATIYMNDRARKLLRFPENQHIRVAISFGFPLEAEAMTAPLVKGGRRPFDEIVHWETW